MNKTEYMNTLSEELEGLPVSVIEETIRFYENQFTKGVEEGKSELEIAEALPKPRLVAAQKKAGAQYQQFKNKMTPNHFASLLIALMGVLVFNFFMIIPAVMYSTVLFVSYLTSFALYGAGTVIMAASLSGVPQMQITLPSHHQHHYSSHHRFEQEFVYENDPISNIVEELNANEHQQATNVSINMSEKGIVVLKEDGQQNKVLKLDDEDQFSKNRRGEKHSHIINIKNKLQKKHALIGFGILLLGISLLLFCLFMTKMTFVWFKQYLLWNLSLLRSPLKSK
jgi:uncharacterized membrane protein